MASLGNDLATIREQEGKSLEDIYEVTKIPVHILQAIEDGSIFTEFDENKTYIRSYIRSYGKALRIEDELVVEALDFYELGTYNGQLIDAVDLKNEQGPTFTYDDEVDGDGDEDQDKSSDKIPHSDSPSKESEDTPKSRHPAAGIRHNTGSPGPSPPSVSSVDWADLGRKFRPLDNRSPIWIGTAVVIIIIIGVVGYWFYQNSGMGGFQNAGQATNTTQNLTEPSIVPDSLQMDVSDPEPDSVANATGMGGLQAAQTLPDTLELQVYAAYERLDPVRINTNLMDNFNPYWIELGQALRFQFTDYIRVMGQYDNMELMLNGHPIENFEQRFVIQVTPDSQYVELQRAQFEGQPQWLQPPPDSNQLTFPPPDTVRNRPIFPTGNN